MNCSFNIRYKPRTTRQFTKSDLTVYDSAGNTALNALTVYGKSEVINGAIISAGEGWATVDLGTLPWVYREDLKPKQFRAYFDQAESVSSADIISRIICPIYKTLSYSDYPNSDECICRFWTSVNGLNVIDSTCTTLTQFLDKINGVMLVYKEATPTNNTIAVKTDNGSGIDGTMATFETGTPLRGIPDTSVRDVMVWDGSSGEVTKNCGKVRLADLSWTYYPSQKRFFATLSNAQLPPGDAQTANIICAKYITRTWDDFKDFVYDDFIAGVQTYIGIRDTSCTTVNALVASLGDSELVYELATPTTTPLTQAENDSITGLRTFEPQTHAQNNAQTEMTVDYTIKVPTI